MKVLVACECSGRVRQAFRAQGHDAWSCDLQPATDGSPHHLQQDAVAVAYDDSYGWDMMIAHPPCTHLASSGAQHFAAKRADGRQQEAIDFFLALANAPIAKKALENPVSIMSTVYKKPTQIIHPWQFGEVDNKRTCLWLEGLPKLVPTKIVEKKFRVNGIHEMSQHPDRSKNRSKTYFGVAKAFANQWGNQ